MAGLTAAWELSRPEHRGEIAGVTVYQRGWRLGGKGASSRGAHGRIEEHGLHVWLGYYDNAFRLMRQVYEELDRPARDPGCPIATWRDAFAPATVVAAADRGTTGTARGGAWVADFRGNDLVPGDAASAGPLDVGGFAAQSLGLLADLWSSLVPARPEPRRGVFLSASPRPPRGGGAPGPADDAARRVAAVAVAGALQALAITGATAGALAGPRRAAALDVLADLQAILRSRMRDDIAARRTWHVSDLVTSCLRGMVADGLVGGPERYPTIDDRDFRAWLADHGASPETLWSPVVNALYDFVFAYEDGDPDRPAFAAGLGLFLAGKLFFEYKGALFWKMQAGMGDVVFAPLYQALRARGVRFEFFTRVDALHLAGDGRTVAAVDVARQARPVPGGYDPLVRVRGLPCFPSVPRADRLAGAAPLDAERHDGDRGGDEPAVLRAGEDYDVVVLATSLGMVPHVASELVDASPRWRAMVRHVATVPTQAAQLWLTCSEAELGWPHAGVTMSGWTRPFDTYASMGHLLAAEDWPAGRGPRGLVYLCSARAAGGRPDAASVRRAVGRLVDEQLGDVWPQAPPSGAVLHGGLEAQHVVLSDDPSDRYVQSLPGTGRHRLRPDESGVDNLVLAGDWTNCGLNAGCIEAAVLSGLEAANAVLGRPRLDGILGTWYPLALGEPPA